MIIAPTIQRVLAGEGTVEDLFTAAAEQINARLQAQ